MNAPTWLDIDAARVPDASLADLGGLRRVPALTVQRAADGTAWLRFPRGTEEVLLALRPLAGVQFFAERHGEWFPFGGRVPTAVKPPERAGIPLDRFLMPGKVAIRTADAISSSKSSLQLVRSSEVAPATLLACSMEELQPWIDGATTKEIESLSAAHCEGRVLLRGGVLPYIADGSRYCGQRVLVPLGFRCEPDWPEDWILSACGVGPGELLLLGEVQNEIVSADAFGPATRAGLRLALRGRAGG